MGIWGPGSVTDCYCIVPSEYKWPDDPDREYYVVSDAIYNKLKATHYHRKWEEKGKSVLLEFFCADSFGAAWNLGPIVHREIVELQEYK